MNEKKGMSKAAKMMLIVFVMLSVFFLLGKKMIEAKGIDVSVVLVGNFILFLLGIFTVTRAAKAIADPNPHKFVQVYYAGFIIRLFVCAAAAGLYFYFINGAVNKFGLFICLGIYILYSVIEVSSLKKLLGEKKNG
jgi:hypothetical protein